ncbi:hypothetical protein KQ940_13320 [Marinobacterium sp. D7]|uniref:hypothetical protein n=1 Tax=Marinobacterium ramblicola TaxID=2849041 RepID=UPI001C2D1579|nr:hypothetical protein [Marinobacterium ramblicola]MBV1789032.1 hypothetical protein [Marinobacterium ramblicola]
MAKNKNGIKAGNRKQGILVKANEPQSTEKLPLIFSLERVQRGNYCFSTLDKEHKAAFADSIFKRKELLWSDIKGAGRHGLGTEKISKSAINTSIPPFITEDQDHFLAFRYHGLNPIVGYRIGQIFYVLWFDHDFTLYDY